jgi:hypothetical protein
LHPQGYARLSLLHVSYGFDAFLRSRALEAVIGPGSRDHWIGLVVP